MIQLRSLNMSWVVKRLQSLPSDCLLEHVMNQEGRKGNIMMCLVSKTFDHRIQLVCADR